MTTKALFIAGLGFSALGLLFTWLRGGEKDAILCLGHWFDITWELAVPSLSVGLLCLFVSMTSSLPLCRRLTLCCEVLENALFDAGHSELLKPSRPSVVSRPGFLQRLFRRQR
jgi:hypothetical protein